MFDRWGQWLPWSSAVVNQWSSRGCSCWEGSNRSHQYMPDAKETHMQISTLFLKITQGKYFIFKGKPRLAWGPLCEATCAFPPSTRRKDLGITEKNFTFIYFLISHYIFSKIPQLWVLLQPLNQVHNYDFALHVFNYTNIVQKNSK